MKTKISLIPLIVIMLLLLPLKNFFITTDDTAALQTIFSSSTPQTLLLKHAYTISSTLNQTCPNINLNGSTITFTPTNGDIIHCQAHTTLFNGRIKGTWVVGNSVNVNAGVTAVTQYGDSVTLRKLHITGVSHSGIFGNKNKLYCTNDIVDSTGYIALYYDSESAKSFVRIVNCKFDRSMIPANTIIEGAICIRGRTADTGLTKIVSQVLLTNNVFKMPLNPTDWSASCIEIRHFKNASLIGNTFQGGSIGDSNVDGQSLTFKNNKAWNYQLEGLECADIRGGAFRGNSLNGNTGGFISNQQQNGILIEGFTYGSNNLVFTSDSVKNNNHACINTNNSMVTSLTFTTGNYFCTALNQSAFDLIGATGVNISNSNIDGGHVAGFGITLDTSVGNLTVSSCNISNFTQNPLFIYSTTATNVNNIFFNDCVYTSINSGYQTYSNPVLGSSILMSN